jgi:hypothetical protein
MINSVESLINISVEKNIEQNGELTILDLAEKFDLMDVQILRKFYMTGKDFPNDTQPWCFPVLYMEMKITNRLKIGQEALRKRVDNMVRIGLLEKVKNSNPANYFPVKGRENLIRASIVRFFTLNGIMQYL